MTAIFLSYRRNDSAGFAGRLASDLEKALGYNAVFRDVDDIVAGEQFDLAIRHRLQSVDVVLVVIGPNWWAGRPDGSCRIDDPDDFVRLEISAAIASEKPIIPVLVGGAAMPAPADLPDDLTPLSRFQAIEMSDARWNYDLNRLVSVLAPAIQGSERPERNRSIRRSRKTLVVVLLVVAAVGAAGAYWWMHRIPQLGGLWFLPSGSYWTIDQVGSRLDIVETHHEVHRAWMRGTGSISGRTLSATLDPVYDNPYGYKFLYRLELATDGRQLSGTITEIVRNRENPFNLRRR